METKAQSAFRFINETISESEAYLEQIAKLQIRHSEFALLKICKLKIRAIKWFLKEADEPMQIYDCYVELIKIIVDIEEQIDEGYQRLAALYKKQDKLPFVPIKTRKFDFPEVTGAVDEGWAILA